jgi:hypothetical protein
MLGSKDNTPLDILAKGIILKHSFLKTKNASGARMSLKGIPEPIRLNGNGPAAVEDDEIRRLPLSRVRDEKVRRVEGILSQKTCRNA